MATDERIQLQQLSHGIKPDLEAEGWHMCYYSEMADNSRNEEYYFPCSNDRQCCGRECCLPVTGGFPLWLLILIVVLSFLLVLLVILCVIYYCWKYCTKKKKAPTPPPQKHTPVVVQKTPHPPPPKVEMFKRSPLISGGVLRRISDDNLIEIKSAGSYTTTTNTATTPVSVNSSSTPSYYYGHSTATRPKNFPSTTVPSAILGSVSPKHRARRPNAFRAHQQDHSTATDSSPGEELIGEHSKDALIADRERTPYRYPGLSPRQQGIIGSGSERYSLTMTTPTSNTASEREQSFVPSPMEETFENAPRPIRVEHHDEKEITQEKRPLLSHVETPREMKARIAVLRPFVPDSMEEIIIPPPTREDIGYHFASEISRERYAEKSVVEPPQGNRAQVIYYIPGEDIVASY